MKFIKDIGWNIVAFLIPLFVAIPVLGVMTRNMGAELFGLFTLALAVFGYSNLFDLGLSRATVRCIALNQGKITAVKEYIATATIFVICFSLIPILVFSFCSKELVDLINVSPSMKSDAVSAVRLLSIIFPLLLITTVWQSYLEGCELFKELSIIKLIGSVLMSVIPLIMILIESSLRFAVLGLLIARVLTTNLVVIYTVKSIGWINYHQFKIARLKELFSYGGWLTVTNILSPIMSSLDRFVLSSMSGAGKVAFYTAPAEMIGRMLIIPGVISRTAFPRLVKKSDYSFKTRLKIVNAIIALLMVSPLFIWSESILVYWLGSDYSGSSITLKILSLGLFFNTLTQVPYTSVQAAGYSKKAAMIHVFECIPYLVLLYFCVNEYSYNGAAMAWSARMILDFILFTILERKVSV